MSTKVRLGAAALVLAALAAGVVASLGRPAPAEGAFPGGNGDIVVSSFGRLWLADPTKPNDRQITDEGGADTQARFSPTSDRIVFLHRVGEGGFDSGLNEIHVMGLGAGEGSVTRLTHTPEASESWPAFSPSGRQIIFQRNADTTGSESPDGLWVMGADGSGQRKISAPGGPSDRASCPVFSPVGDQIAFVDRRHPTTGEAEPSGPLEGDESIQDYGIPNIYVANADGSGLRRVTENRVRQDDGVPIAEPVGCPEFSPDGARIAFVGDEMEGGGSIDYELFLVSTAGGRAAKLVDDVCGGCGAAFSPDGKQIAFGGNDGRLWVFGPGGANKVSNLAAFSVDWGAIADRDGDSLLDAWEEHGIDANGDGDVDDKGDVNLPKMGADPDHKDIFVEVDHMPGYRLEAEPLKMVAQAFDRAPVANPDGRDGITLHVDNGPDSVMNPNTGAKWGGLSRQDAIPSSQFYGGDSPNPFETAVVKQHRERYFTKERRSSFFYARTVHGLKSGGRKILGRAADIPSTDFLLVGNPPSPWRDLSAAHYVSALFMHELGHALGLGHGGPGDHTLGKPNQLSVMNYVYMWRGGLDHLKRGRVLDYSRYGLQTLDERRLSEPAGLYPLGYAPTGAEGYATAWTCPNGTKKLIWILSSSGFSKDFNCDGDKDDSTQVNLNANFDARMEPLVSRPEWNSLIYDGGGPIGNPGTVTQQRNARGYSVATPPEEPPIKLGKKWARAWSKALDPKLGLKARKRQQMARRRAAVISATCRIGDLYRSSGEADAAEPCALRAFGKVAVKGGRSFKVASKSAKVGSGKKAKLKLAAKGRKSKRALAAALRRDRRGRAKLTVTATDAAGHQSSKRLTLRLRG